MNKDISGGLPRLTMPLIVEGRYDKAAVLSMFSGVVVTTDGFGVFNSKEKRALIKRLAEGGIILLTDSDGGGNQIRSFIASIIPKEKIYNVYVPRIEGKEKRKLRPSREGVLGVEGVGGEVLRRVLSPYTAEGRPERSGINVPLLYGLGLTGGEDSAALRDKVLLSIGLPPGMSAKAFALAVELLMTAEELRAAVESLGADG